LNKSHRKVVTKYLYSVERRTKRVVKTRESSGGKKMRPAITPEMREQQLTALAMDLAEKQLREGTASSQTINHFLNIASTREKIELENLKKKGSVMDAQIKEMESTEDIKELLENAMNAFKGYRTTQSDEED
jgi:hypothetical protein